MSHIEVVPVDYQAIAPYRELYRRAMNCQIVHDSLPRRGFGKLYLIQRDGRVAGHGFVMGYGDEPKDLVREFHVLPVERPRASELFRALVAASGATRIQAQSNDTLLALMMYDHAREITSDTIVFHDAVTTSLQHPDATFRPVTPDDTGRIFAHDVEPEGNWLLEIEGVVVATGGFLTHYNPPYGDIFMEVAPDQRRKGLGGFLVQELKRVAHESGHVPTARCNATNIASRATLQKAGFAPCARLLQGVIVMDHDSTGN